MGNARSAVSEQSSPSSTTSASASPPQGANPPSLVERVTGPYRATMRFLGRRALARATLALPRTLRFLSSAAVTGEVAADVAAPSLSLGLAAGVAMDEALLAMAMAPSRFPRRADYTRVSTELAEARRMFSRRGWLNRPDTYHRRPTAITDDDVEIHRGRAHGIAYERLGYDSGFSTRAAEPGGGRWMDYGPNRRAYATIVRHEGEQRPWMVCVHGFCMGYPLADFVGLHTARLHRELGLNLALPVLPLHGPRKVTFVSGEPFLSFDLMNTVHGLTQAVWDIRRLLSWIRAQGATSIGLYGVSLGAYVVSLLASLEDGLDLVVAGIPVTDFPTLFQAHSPLHIRARAIEHRIMGDVADDVFKVVSPLALTPKITRQRRFIYAGYADRLAFPDQARRLWKHWEEPSISWYAGNHVGYLWSS
ncbi:MAG TPA: alpha/beta hydrolase, partial [Acidimicrobiales bacterium]|nr:alpha/beta hydrolase [Acidimicrobiales bacterium]